MDTSICRGLVPAKNCLWQKVLLTFLKNDKHFTSKPSGQFEPWFLATVGLGTYQTKSQNWGSYMYIAWKIYMLTVSKNLRKYYTQQKKKKHDTL